MKEILHEESEDISDTSSNLSDLESEIFDNFDFDFKASIAPSSNTSHRATTTEPSPNTTSARAGSSEADSSHSSSRSSHQVTDTVFNNEISLGTHDYDRSMSVASDTIVVDHLSPTLTRRMSQTRCVGLLSKKTPVKRATKKAAANTKDTPNNEAGKKTARAKIRTERANGRKPDGNLEEGDEEGDEKGDTDTEEDTPAKKGASYTRKRKRPADTDEMFDGDSMVSMGTAVGNTPKKGRPVTKGRLIIKKRAVNPRAPPVMGNFNVGSRSLTPSIESSSRPNEEAADPIPVEDDPWELNEPMFQMKDDKPMFQTEDDEATKAAKFRAKQLIGFTEFPPEDSYYTCVPQHNRRWTVCIIPEKPTWYHPDWDASRRKEADSETAELVKKGKECVKMDKRKGAFEVRKTGRSLITKQTVIWWQAHRSATGKRWALNYSLSGYDECEY